jgi:hypothetical protein
MYENRMIKPIEIVLRMDEEDWKREWIWLEYTVFIYGSIMMKRFFQLTYANKNIKKRGKKKINKILDQRGHSGRYHWNSKNH